MPTNGFIKEKARNLLNKWLTPDDLPPSPPPKPKADLVQSFNTLALTDKPTPNIPFVGGFNPGYLPHVALSSASTMGQSSSLSRPTFPHSPGMPTPRIPSSNVQSLTMQMALLPDSDLISAPVPQASRPHPKPDLVSQSTSSFMPVSRPLRTEDTGLSISTPCLIPSRSRPVSAFASSAPSTSNTLAIPRPLLQSGKSDPSSDKSTVTDNQSLFQCAGITKAGKRCTRTVKNGAALSQYMDRDSRDDFLERFCFQHAKEVLGPSGFYARKNGEWVTFEGRFPP